MLSDVVILCDTPQTLPCARPPYLPLPLSSLASICPKGTDVRVALLAGYLPIMVLTSIHYITVLDIIPKVFT